MILAFTGYAGSGKDTIAEALIDNYGFARVAFADKLKELAWEINPMIDSNYHLQDFKECEWPDEDLDPIECVDRAKADSEVRRFLQNLGQAMRLQVAADFWIDRALEDIRDLICSYDHIVVTDVRYPNEWAALQGYGERTGEEAHLVRIMRTGVGPKNSHISEENVDLLTDQASFTVVNDIPAIESAAAIAQQLKL